MARTSNLSVSLPLTTIDAVRRYARRHRITLSAAVRESLEAFLRKEEAEEVERQIADYFADPKVRREEERLTDLWMRASTLWGAPHAHAAAPARRRVCR